MDTVDAKDGSGVNQEVGGLVSPDAPKFDPNSLNTFHDLDDVDASSGADDKKLGDEEAKKAADAKAAEEKAAAAKAAEDERFDKHPRFQKIMAERDEARLQAARLEGKIESISPKVDTAKPAALPFKDIRGLTAEQIREWQDEDPKGFADNLRAQSTHEAKEAIRAELRTREASTKEYNDLKKTYDNFEKKNPEFRKMWDAGEIVAFIEKNPGHNPISAYLEMTGDTITAKHQKAIEEAVAKAKKETEDEVTKRFAAKKKATTLTGSPAGVVQQGEDPALSDSKKHGGRTSVLADRLRALRSGR
jgi:hypothetical protein